MEDAKVHEYKQPEIKLDKHIHEARHEIMRVTKGEQFRSQKTTNKPNNKDTTQ